MIGSGCVIAIGGNEDKRGARTSILGRFVQRAGGRSARIVIIPSASEYPEARVQRYLGIFQQLGASDIRAVHAERDVTHEDREAIRGASGIFVTDGDQKKLMEYLHAAECVEPIRQAVRGGAVYAGTSAGAAVASKTMIAGDGENGELVELGEGIGLLPDVIIDQHFGERRRLPRLVVAAKTRKLVGVGIDEDTAIVWNGSNGEMRVEGVGKVTVVDREHRLHVLGAR